jgi:hypothetical protein
MDILETSHEEDVIANINTMFESGNETQISSIRQQRNQRERDRRSRLKNNSSNYHKRKNDPLLNNHMLSENNFSFVTETNEPIVHQNFYTSSTSNQETSRTLNSEYELEDSIQGFHIPSAAYVLPLSTYCIHCNARKFYRESKGFCCSDGKIKLFICDSPFDLYNLFTSKEHHCIEFKKFVRGYNNHLAFTSFGVKYDKNLFKTYKGIYTFRIQGQVHHYISNLMPNNNTPCYMQLYFYDTENELQNRMNISSNFVESTLLFLLEILKKNPYSKFFRSLIDMPNLHDHQIQIRCDPGLDQRVFNIPTTSQVAAVWVENDKNANIRSRDIIIYGHSNDSHKVHYYYGCYDPLQYPLLFPYGESGWHEGIEKYKSTHFQSEHMSTFNVFPNTNTTAVEFIEEENQG